MTSALIFQLIVLIFSVIIHEVAHGVMALRLGDDTAQRLGRLTFNPLKHLDFFGSVLLPLLLIVTRSPFIIGWAKPVPYDPRNMKDPKTGAALVALAGPASNLAIAVIFGLALRFLGVGGVTAGLLSVVVYLNLLLAVFNLVPIPPLDGSKLFYYFIPNHYRQWQATLELYGPFLLIIFILIGFPVLIPLIEFLFRLIVGH